MTTPLQDAAREYVAAGLHILALHGKKPNGAVHGESWSYEDSFHGAPADDIEREAFERSFTEKAGTTGIAICIPPDYLVADVDTDRAAALLLELGYEPSLDSIVAKTKNGLHLWFWWPGADRNRWVGDGEMPDPTRTLLFKGFGGYVVAPPSLHFDDATGVVDGSYSWGTPLVSGGTRYMPDVLPDGIRARFTRDDLWTADRTEGKQKMATFTLEPAEGLQWWQWPKVFDYQTAGLEKAIENAADGNQNNVIYWAAMVAKEEGVPYSVAMDRLLAAAIEGGHPRDRARDTIRGAYKGHRAV